MSYAQAVVLGVVQGLTEFLPISSSGHLLLVPYVFGWPDQGLTVDAALHLGTLAALLAYFSSDLAGLVTGTRSRRLALLRSPLVVAAATALWAVVMDVADRRAPAPATGPDPLERLTTRQAVIVGCAQALALIPGTSRSGITITAGLLTGLDRPTAARFGFLLGIPITAAAGGLKLVELVRLGLGPGQLGPVLAAVVAAFLSGWVAVWFLVTYLKRRSLRPFVVYRLLLAGIILAVTLG